MKTGLKSILGVIALGLGICFCWHFIANSQSRWQSLDDPGAPDDAPVVALVPGDDLATPVEPPEFHGRLSSTDRESQFQPSRLTIGTAPESAGSQQQIRNVTRDDPMRQIRNLPRVTTRSRDDSGAVVSIESPSRPRFVENPFTETSAHAGHTRALPAIGDAGALSSQPPQVPDLDAPHQQHSSAAIDTIQSVASDRADKGPAVAGHRDSPFVAPSGSDNHPPTALAQLDVNKNPEQKPLDPVLPENRMSPSLPLAAGPNPDSLSANEPNAGAEESQNAAIASSSIVEQRAREHMNYGKSLARRGASFAAREEFMQALRLVAEARDIQSNDRRHTTRLAAGLRALSESDDFVTLNAEQQLNLDLAPIVAMHSSPVFSDEDLASLKPIQALQAYYQYAVHQISQAVGGSTAAAETLHAMGKLMMASSRFDAAGKPIDRARAMVMFRSALAANPSDHRSANELGVLMARNGKWKQARELFTQSLISKKTPEAWINLAKAHEQLGEPKLSRQASNEYRLLVEQGAEQSDSAMAWVSSEQFDSRGATPARLEQTGQPRTAEHSATSSDTKSVGKGVFGSFGKWF